MTLDKFFECFFPDEHETIYLRGFSPKEMDAEVKAPVFERKATRTHLRENKLLQSNLIATNEKQGLYFAVNSGGFKKEDITRINACFCEIDTIPIVDQHDLYENCHYPPSLRLETKKSVHAYWLLSEPITVAQWSEIQHGLIKYFNSDAGIKNENRVMRLPFFNHVAWNGEFHYKPVSIYSFNPECRFSYAELKEAFPYTAPVHAPVKRYNNDGFDGETMPGISQELRYRIAQTPSYRVESDRIHATAHGVCHDGEGKTALMVNLRTGEVFCHSGCDYWKIAATFGLFKPVKQSGITRVSPRQNHSELYRYLQEQAV